MGEKKGSYQEQGSDNEAYCAWRRGRVNVGGDETDKHKQNAVM